MNIVAILAFRDGEFYLPTLLQHLRSNGISVYVIDNESVDSSSDIVQDFNDIIVGYETLAYRGYFDLSEQLECKRRVIEKLDADWIIHIDVDELLYSDTEGESLKEAITRVDELGCDCINFDEFVFLPVDRFGLYNPKNFHKMRYYYFFEPKKHRLKRAFKKGASIKVNSGGHDIEGVERMYSSNFIMRHYMFKNKKHAQQKYHDRSYAQGDLDKRFHGNRIVLQNQPLVLPKKSELSRLTHLSNNPVAKTPYDKHFWQWSK